MISQETNKRLLKLSIVCMLLPLLIVVVVGFLAMDLNMRAHGAPFNASGLVKAIPQPVNDTTLLKQIIANQHQLSIQLQQMNANRTAQQLMVLSKQINQLDNMVAQLVNLTRK